ncbi:MAG TPA: histidine kinase dimerization/phospho-acceptor domain-containing protein [Myxococcota bacterium]|jgi:signal transduction histidine kinase|nr:histidine kinase dimerization/phospho-acceptor domain-containing protein [Myxococcota bacterium]
MARRRGATGGGGAGGKAPRPKRAAPAHGAPLPAPAAAGAASPAAPAAAPPAQTSYEEILSRLCHDLASPLGAVMLNAGLLRDLLADSSDARARRSADVIVRAADEMNRMLRTAWAARDGVRGR